MTAFYTVLEGNLLPKANKPKVIKEGLICHCDGFIPQVLLSNKFCCKLCGPRFTSTTLDSLSVGFIQNPYAKSMY